MKKYIFALCCFCSAVNFAQTGSWKNYSTEGEVLARHENAMAKVGNKIVLIGGRGNKPLNILDLETNEWTNGAQPPFEIHHLQAVSLDGLIYVLGAFTGGWPFETPLSHVFIYDISNDIWITGPEIPENRRRGAAGVAVFEDKIYLVNGIINGHTSGWVNWLDEFDPYTGEWKILPNAPVARDHFHAAVINKKLYVAGGRRSGSVEGNGFAGTVSETNVYDFNSQKWEILPNIPTPRAGATTAVLNDKLIILGGESDLQEKAHGEIELYDPSSKNWKNLPILGTGRHGTQAVTIQNNILIGAGSENRGGGPELTSFEIYSAEKNPVLQSDSLQVGEIVPSLQKLNFLKTGDTQYFTLKNSSKNLAIPITYLQTNRPENFKVETPGRLPLILAPGTSIDIQITEKADTLLRKNAVLFIKPAGAQAPLEIELITQ
ncbi:Kelch repeat-containing protein [Salinimicrobium sp. GXAS 041]|uniref:Kelch repeat-containing protein n=1 Tax=Salinimicrobium sp. GXAS 041 TaxID=3400806 RepID=UPI003C7952DE